ncbi:rhomboid family intramembrane serine protease [Gimesia panareensis]|uniref:Rhomboid protease GlpG n=1 Tax=Gimesia panareensis TaxID=2527978 RepID=A0A517Q5G7_9PLAN|nr:rhomboid family intramembrane serine protease [Gimesia panareensis]QDT26868.1 Rhomboid protease GlpG [Gimesia panareensis]QDU50295.1 Rhomboid protease GlpG [Gimesia panareensis]
MRKIGTLPSEQQAKLFEDFLLTEQIGANIDASGDEWNIWVLDEDQVEQAKSELAAFEQEPTAAKYQAATRQAEAIRDEKIAQARAAVKRQVKVRETWNQPFTSRCPVTSLLIGVSVVVYIFLEYSDFSIQIRQALGICSFQVSGDMIRYDTRLLDIREGEFWRLITPIFMHFNFMHILFDGFMTYQLGGAIEIKKGSTKLALMVILIAIPSNLAQFYWGGDHFSNGGPGFGGLSGVVYGLFGYMWMKSQYDPQSSFYVPPNMVTILMVFYFLCLSGVFEEFTGKIANMAHTVGLIMGIAIGLGSTWLREAGKSR